MMIQKNRSECAIMVRKNAINGHWRGNFTTGLNSDGSEEGHLEKLVFDKPML